MKSRPRKSRCYSNALYIEDLKHARNCLSYLAPEIVANIFRLNPRQMESAVSGNLSHSYSVNSASVRKAKGLSMRGRNKVMTERSVEAAATLHYLGFTLKEIAKMYGTVDYTTIGKALTKYHGYINDRRTIDAVV